MDEVEEQRLRQLIQDKKAEWFGKHARREITPERQAEIDTLLNNIRKEIVTFQTGPNDYWLTTRAGLLEELAKRGIRLEETNKGCIFHGILNKGILMVLPEESYLMSNICHDDGTRIFGGVVGPQSEREQLWRKLRDMHVTGRRAYVFEDAECGHAEEARRRLVWAKRYPERQRA